MPFGEEQFRNWLLSLDLDLFGFARMEDYDGEILGVEEEVIYALPYAVSIGIRLSRAVLSTVKDGPNLLYYHHYRQINLRLDACATLISRKLEEEGFMALPLPASQIVDWKRQYGHISHKKIANLAGLGWIGRNNLLVNETFGSQIRLTTILTDMPLNPGKRLDFGCNGCKMCLSVCPAGAIKEDPRDFDHIGCYKMITEMKNKRNIGQHICGICVEICKGKIREVLQAHKGIKTP